MFTPQIPGISPIGAPFGSPLINRPVSQPLAPTPTQPPEQDFDRSIDYYADYSGCGHWRMIWPGHMLNAHQKAVIHGSTMMCLDERWYANTSAVRLQRQATEHQLRFVRLLRQFSQKYNFRIMYEIDDLVFHEDIPDYNKFKTAFTDPKIRQCALDIMGEVDEITVTNKFMQQYYQNKTGNKNVTVIPNYPPKWWIGHYHDQDKIIRNYKRYRKKPRILYSASGAHFDVTLSHLVQQGKIEFHPWQRLYEYPALVDSLNCNMFIAPLQDNTFNKAKSDLKYIEACCYGVPIACQDLCTYEDAPYKFTTGDEMIDVIKSVMGNYSNYIKAGKDARQVAEGRWLELDCNIDKYAELYKHPYKSSERKLINSLAANK